MPPLTPVFSSSTEYHTQYYEFTGVGSCWDVIHLHRLLWASVVLNVISLFLGIITAAILGAYKDMVGLCVPPPRCSGRPGVQRRCESLKGRPCVTASQGFSFRLTTSGSGLFFVLFSFFPIAPGRVLNLLCFAMGLSFRLPKPVLFLFEIFQLGICPQKALCRSLDDASQQLGTNCVTRNTLYLRLLCWGEKNQRHIKSRISRQGGDSFPDLMDFAVIVFSVIRFYNLEKPIRKSSCVLLLQLLLTSALTSVSCS